MSNTDKQLFQYRGRIPTRADGRARRMNILEATLALIVEEGIRGVRHRAVAEKADVPLAATTYYFDDINDLIHDAFIYFSEKSMQDVEKFEERSYDALKAMAESGKEFNVSVFDQLVSFTYEHILNQVKQKDLRILEHTFKMQALRDDRISVMVKAVDRKMTKSIEKFISIIGLPEAPLRARVILNMMLRLEFEIMIGLCNAEEARDMICQTLEKALFIHT